MVVLAATVCAKNGKVVVSRQFLDMSRSRIEGLMASFPKLIATNTQHTTIDTEEVRFVYQPIDTLFLVLITSKRSNILQDIGTLHLFARVVSEYCNNRSLDEKEVLEHAFELLGAFDEIVSMGYRESVNLAQIRTISEMDSNEERIQEMIAKNKEMEAKEQSRMKAKQMEMQRKQMQRMSNGNPGMGMGMGNNGVGSSSSSYGSGGYMAPTTAFGGPTRPGQTSPTRAPNEYMSSAAVANSQKTGMKLGASKKTADFGDVFASAPAGGQRIEPAMESLNTYKNSNVAGGVISSTTNAPSTQTPTEVVHILVEERMTVVANRDGGLQNMEVKGKLILKLSDPEKSHLKLAVKTSQNDEVQFKTHPNVDKKLFQSEGIIALKDQTKPFPVGQSTGVLQWRFASKDESAIPLSSFVCSSLYLPSNVVINIFISTYKVNCWPSPSADGTCDVNIEYVLESTKLALKNVSIAIPLPPSGQQPNIGDIDGHYQYDRARHTLYWQLPLIDASNKTGTLDFKTAGQEPGSFFPVTVSFTCDMPYCDVEILRVTSASSNEDVVYSQQMVLQPEEYSFV